ncbi:ATP-binding protein [Streptomyces sp. RB6PN25]|uniref:ATP-binding protein n=1 Tax=Streptomyces humicola TaxID=2953240 RepID=A0ABT1Q8D0_9ACTN|nr:ATP-binding protein [Streptomyces humicola]MCQ4085042.1 ATP-binding protein [Streptomyces humicola]
MESELPPIAPDFWQMRLRADPRHLAVVRRTVHTQLRLWGRDNLAREAAMCVTELLSNVHKHVASPECVLTLRGTEDGVHVTVSDSEPELPVVGEPDYLSERGRGMFLLSKTADEWGAVPTATGKDVWFVLR